MPRVDHPNVGDVLEHVYLTATVTEVDGSNDTVNFNGISPCPNGEDIPLFYHCTPDSELRDNGALEGAAGAFNVGNKIIVQCEILSAENYNPLRVIGFTDKPKICSSKRFFVQVNRGSVEFPSCEYYWIDFLLRDGTYSLRASQAGDTSFLGVVVETPKENDHINTKAFMLVKDEEEGEEKERWVATPHLLIKDRIQQFNPLSYPYEGTLWPGGLAFYPCPPAFLAGPAIRRGHPAPPNRFYCNVDEKIMVWYSCHTIIDPLPPYEILHYCFGIILKVSDNNDEIIETIKTFNCLSSEADGEGFDPYWYTEKLNPICPGDPMCGADEEVPYQMLTDVNYLDEDKIEIFLPWSARPVKFTVDLTGSSVSGGNHTYAAVSSADHWFWTKEGFEQELFAEFYQTFNGGLSDYDSDSGSGSSSDCSGGDEAGCIPGCPGSGIGNVHNQDWYRWRSISYGAQDKHSWYRINIFDEEEFTESFWLLGRKVIEYRYANASYCRWDSFLHSCSGPFLSGWQAKRWMLEHTMQKVVRSVIAEWSSPNIAFVGQEINRIFADNEATQYPLVVHTWGWNCVDAPACMDMCACGDTPFDCGSDSLGGANCFMGYPLAGDDDFTPHWALAPTYEQFQSVLGGCQQTRSLDSNSLGKPFVLEFRVDGELTFDSTKVNRTFYLDDRSSEESQGLVVAGEGFIPGAFDPLIVEWGADIPFYWKIYWVNPDSDFENAKDITDNLLTALNCQKEQLCKIGLI